MNWKLERHINCSRRKCTWNRILRYRSFYSSTLPYTQFTLHHPIAIERGFKDEYQNPFMQFAMVRGISSWSDEVPGNVLYSITVEVHMEPGFSLDWARTCPWPHIPVGAIFVYPHGFQSAIHEPLSLAYVPYSQVITVQFDVPALLEQMAVDQETQEIMTNRIHT